MLSSSTHTLGRNLAPIPFYIATGYDRSPRRASPDNRDLGRGRSRSPIVDRRDQGAFERPRVESANTGSNLFVSGLSMDAREEDLGAVFSKYGKITKCEVMFDPRSKGSHGFRPSPSFVQVEAGMMNVTRIVAGADMMTVTEVAMMTEIETETETETEIEIAILWERRQRSVETLLSVHILSILSLFVNLGATDIISSSISSVTKPTSATSGSDSLLVPATSLVRRPLLDLDLSAGLLLDLRRRLELLSVTLGLRSRPRSLLRLRLRFRLICRGERDLDGDLDLDQPLEMGGDSPRRRRVSTASSLNDRSFWPDPRT
ncbi:hypothetical protein BSLG_001254 [Batrachochytrium salamandrivorans]|nr:hypothetical protein BSLG_001254 [Batrachochytrium salamandrivorans]